MYQLFKFSIGIFMLCVSMPSFVFAQEDSLKPEVLINLRYFVKNNSVQYLVIESKLKVESKWQPLKNQVLQLYLDSNKAENLITKLQTDSKGIAKAIIPPTLKSLWDATPTHDFIVVTEGSSKEEETITSFTISKARLLIDTISSDGSKAVNIQVLKLENDEWMPAKDVEVTVGIKRSTGIIRIGEEDTYTTDSLGQAIAEFKQDSLPGDEKGELLIIGNIQDHEQFGNLSVEKTANWGRPFINKNSFTGRTLWGARGREPVWLMLMAFMMIAVVWSVIIYLIYLIVRIRKLSKEFPPKKISSIDKTIISSLPAP